MVKADANEYIVSAFTIAVRRHRRLTSLKVLCGEKSHTNSAILETPTYISEILYHVL